MGHCKSNETIKIIVIGKILEDWYIVVQENLEASGGYLIESPQIEISVQKEWEDKQNLVI
ncbi:MULTISPECIES: hypothetical protein [Parachlamydia]|jgi:hypothetical protein|uniref:hypothetical protein n=1 Tax=Parachlamydia TaxID=83551 RepID=UPI0024E1E09B|nr:hypothetical protein [Parachlamydia acanthamoebae]